MFWSEMYVQQLAPFSLDERRKLLALADRVERGLYADDRCNIVGARLRFYRQLFMTGRMRDYGPSLIQHDAKGD